MLSLPNLDSRDTEEEWKVQQCKDARLLDRNFSEWCDHMINEGHAERSKHDTMICGHTDPCKEAKFLDSTSLLLEYIKHCGVFKPKKTNEYDLCCFYKVGLSGDLLSFPSPREPATHELLSKFLLKVRVPGHPNLMVAFVQDSAMAICLLQDSFRFLPIEPKADAGGKAIKKLSFCPLCMYSGSNDISYMNHIMCRHYHANYRCQQCLNEVFTTGQQLKVHLKVCVGLPKEAEDCTPSSPEKEHMFKDHSPNLQPPPPQSSQGSSQVSPHQSQHSKKKKSTPKKADSAMKSSKSGKEESHKKVTNKSKHHNKEMPKRKNIMTKTKQTRTNPVSPARSESPPPAWVVHLLRPFFTVM